MWSVEGGTKVYRLTFSKSLADHINACCGGQFQIVRRTFRTGRLLQPWEQSASGVYAVVDVRKSITLRLPLVQGAAEIMRSESRCIQEAWLL